jgi:hypothetical protein
MGDPKTKLVALGEAVVAGRDDDGSLNPMIVTHLISMLGELAAEAEGATSWLEYSLQCIEAAITDKDKARDRIRKSKPRNQLIWDELDKYLLHVEIELSRARFGIEQTMKGEKYGG